jgi:hypothetical protein
VPVSQSDPTSPRPEGQRGGWPRRPAHNDAARATEVARRTERDILLAGREALLPRFVSQTFPAGKSGDAPSRYVTIVNGGRKCLVRLNKTCCDKGRPHGNCSESARTRVTTRWSGDDEGDDRSGGNQRDLVSATNEALALRSDIPLLRPTLTACVPVSSSALARSQQQLVPGRCARSFSPAHYDKAKADENEGPS